MLGKLLFLKGNPNVPAPATSGAAADKSPLAVAAMAGLPHHVRALCVAKADVNVKCADEANGTSTALIYAAMEGHHKVREYDEWVGVGSGMVKVVVYGPKWVG